MFLLFALSCTDREPVDSGHDGPSLEPPPPGQGFQLEFHSSVEPYSESWDCAVYDIPIEDLQNVNSVEYLNNPGTHHVTLSTLGFNSGGALEPGGAGGVRGARQHGGGGGRGDLGRICAALEGAAISDARDGAREACGGDGDDATDAA